MAAPVIQFAIGPHYFESLHNGPGDRGAFPGETILVVGQNLDTVTSVHIGFVPAEFAAFTSGYGPALNVVVPETAGSDFLFVTNPDGTTQGPQMSIWDPVPGPWKSGLYALQQIGGGNVNSWGASIEVGVSRAVDGTTGFTYFDLVEHFMNRLNAGNSTFNPAWTGFGGTEPEYVYDWTLPNTAFFWLVGGNASWSYVSPGDAEFYGIHQAGALVDAWRWIRHPSYLPDPEVAGDPEWNAFDGPVYFEFDPDDTSRVAWERDMEVSIGFIQPFYEVNDLDPGMATWIARILDSTIRVYMIPGSDMDDSLLHYVTGLGSNNINNEIFGYRSWDNNPYEVTDLEALQLIAEYRFGDFSDINGFYGGGGYYNITLPVAALEGAGAVGFIVSTSLVESVDGPGNTALPSTETGSVFGVYVRASARMPYQGRRYRFYYARPSSQSETPDIDASQRTNRVSFDPSGGPA